MLAQCFWRGVCRTAPVSRQNGAANVLLPCSVRVVHIFIGLCDYLRKKIILKALGVIYLFLSNSTFWLFLTQLWYFCHIPLLVVLNLVRNCTRKLTLVSFQRISKLWNWDLYSQDINVLFWLRFLSRSSSFFLSPRL